MRIKKVKDVVSWEVVGQDIQGVSIIWWLFWLLVFFPMLIFVYIIHHSEVCLIRLKYSNGDVAIVEVSPGDLDSFIKKMDKVGASRIVIKHFKKCPYCAEEIRIEAIICKHCHSDVD